MTNNYKVVVLNGMPLAGKDTFANICRSLMPRGSVQVISTVDKVKEIAASVGWDGVKTAGNRKFLSDLKDLLESFNNTPSKDCWQKIHEHKLQCTQRNQIGITFVMCREPQNIFEFEREGAESVLVRRPVTEKVKQSNHADEEVFDYPYEWLIMNDGRYEDLEESAKTFLSILLDNAADPFNLPFELERQTDFREGKIC